MRTQSGSAAQHFSLFLLLIATALLLGGCGPRGGSPADTVARHFAVVPAGANNGPELVPKITLRNPRGRFDIAARNLHDDCITGSVATLIARVNGVDVYWAAGFAQVSTDNAIVLATAEIGNATAIADGKNSAAYAVPGPAGPARPERAGWLPHNASPKGKGQPKKLADFAVPNHSVRVP